MEKKKGQRQTHHNRKDTIDFWLDVQKDIFLTVDANLCDAGSCKCYDDRHHIDS